MRGRYARGESEEGITSKFQLLNMDNVESASNSLVRKLSRVRGRALEWGGRKVRG